MFNVLLHNDNFTTMEFVIEVLISVFHHDEPTAFRIMLQVHNEGKAVVSSGTREAMEADVNAMHAYGLWASLERAQ